MLKAMRQMPVKAGRASVTCGESVREFVSDEACSPRREHRNTGSGPTEPVPSVLLLQALTKENLQQAWKRVKANKGAAGVDSLTFTACALELAFTTEANPVAKCLCRHTQYLGGHRHRLPTLDQAHRLQLEFQGVFAPLLTVFAFAHFLISNV